MKKGKRRFGFRIIAVAVLALCIILGVNKVKIEKRYNELVRQKAQLEQQIDDEKDRSEEIEEYGIYVKTKKFIKDFAKNVLGLADPDDVIIEEGD